MRILVTGATGFVGVHLLGALERAGHKVSLVSRRPNVGHDWSTDSLREGIERNEAVVHLAGAGVMDKRWSHARKEEILRSRVETTDRIARLVAEIGDRRLVSASAVGFYGDGIVDGDEDSPPGEGFLAEVCQKWEAALDPAIEAGVPTAWVRIGVVLGMGGGALGKMLLPFKLGLGGPLGSGRQSFPWIHVDDLCRSLRHLLEHPELEGPFNAVAPARTDQRTFARTLGRVLGRPAFLPAPGLALRMILGEGASVLLEGQQVAPRRLIESGFTFEHPDLEAALGELVSRGHGPSMKPRGI